MAEYYCLPFSTHPLRNGLYDELHARPFHLVTTPQQLSHLAFRADASDTDTAFNLVCDLCRRYSINQPGPEAASFQADFGQFSLRWERHMEFYSMTFQRPPETQELAFSPSVLELLPGDWLASLPGQAVAAFHIQVQDSTPIDDAILNRAFEGQRLVLSRPKNGKALLCTAFKLHGDGFGRFFIQNLGIDDYRMGRLVQRVIELETYRLLALLSLPMAKRIAPDLLEMDNQLSQMLASIPNIQSSEEERVLLLRLSQLAARVEAHRSDTNYRFSATKAYHELVVSRLHNIREQEVEEHMTLGEFLTRRLSPAIRTCDSIQARLEDLSRRIERAGDLLRTRVNLTIQEQNKCLLASMDRRSRLQFRLQETVEGLSVAAISYYMVGLVSYLLSGLPLESWNLSKKVLLACSVPLVVATVWSVTQHIKHRLIKIPDPESCDL